MRDDSGGDTKEKRGSTGLKIGSAAVTHCPVPLPSFFPSGCFGDSSSALTCACQGSQTTGCPLFEGDKHSSS